MSENNQFYFHSSIRNMKAPYSLKDRTLTKIAVQICRYLNFKNHFLIKPKQVQTYYSMNRIKAIVPFCVWEDFVTEQSSAICETLLPQKLKSQLMLRIREISIHMLCWYKNQELRLQITPQIADRFLLSTDWTPKGTIDERMIAERLVQDEMIPVPQRYQLACSFFLEPFIRSLWNQMPAKSLESFCYESTFNIEPSIMNLFASKFPNLSSVRLWSGYLKGSVKEFIGRKDLFWQRGFELTVKEGQSAAVFCCWEALSDIQKQEAIIAAAVCALHEYCESRCIQEIVCQTKETVKYGDRKRVGIEYWEYVGTVLPVHYRDIFNFLFSQMSEEQRFEFFQDAFDFNSNVLGAFTKLPMNRPRLKTIDQGLSKLWGILPLKYFIRFLSIISRRYINRCDSQDFDYEHLLLELLESTPDHYKTYLFRNKREPVQCEDNVDFLLLLKVFKENPFEQINIEMIEIILQQATVEEKHALVHSECGSEMCVYFMKNNKLEAVDLILKYCLSEDEIPNFRKEFLASARGLYICMEMLGQDNFESVHLLLQWGNFLQSEIVDIKSKMIRAGALGVLFDLLRENKLDCLDKIEEFCLSSDDARKEFRQEFFTLCANTIYNRILESNVYRHLMEFIRKDFVWEQNLAPFQGRDCTQVLVSSFLSIWGLAGDVLKEVDEDDIQDNEIVVKWFGGSPKEMAMDLIKKDVIPRIQEKIFRLLLSEDTKNAVGYLKWYLSGKSAVTFKKEFEKYVTQNEDIEINYETKQRILGTLDQLIKDHISERRQPRKRKRQEMDLLAHFNKAYLSKFIPPP